MKLIENAYIYWQFIRELRYHPDNLDGFVNTDPVTLEDQVKYMNQYGYNYYICLKDEKPVGFIGEVDGDIR